MIVAFFVVVAFGLYQGAKQPYRSLADELLAGAPGARKLVLGIDWIGFGDFPGFGFEYETRVGPLLTHKHFHDRLVAAHFSRESDEWVYGQRRAFYRQSQSRIVCDITWRPGDEACMPGYKRENCDPTYDLVLGSCHWLR